MLIIRGVMYITYSLCAVTDVEHMSKTKPTTLVYRLPVNGAKSPSPETRMISDRLITPLYFYANIKNEAPKFDICFKTAKCFCYILFLTLE